MILDVLIVGAGPSGLAAAIACQRLGLAYDLLEKGVLVNSIFHFPSHMAFFTTPELLEVGGYPFVSPFEKPTRLEALRYYRRVVDGQRLTVTLGEEVQGVERQPADNTFLVRSTTRHGVEHRHVARAVVLAIGYYDHPNRLGVPGEDLPHVSHYYDEAHPFYRQRVVVVGGANSAAESALELHRAGAHVTLVHRHAVLDDGIKYWVRPDILNRISEGSIAVRYETEVVEISRDAVVVDHAGARDTIAADAVFLLTGYHPDREFLGRCGVQFDPATCAPVHDADTFETSVPNLFLAGGVTVGHGTAPVFIENGRLHGEKIVAMIARRLS
ncbi:MAG TPA: YpdA family putative bacillithiol disulfide reductase [Vicinamibacterales bacterium]|jgi:thioredoxin reductase (NADPH)